MALRLELKHVGLRYPIVSSSTRSLQLELYKSASTALRRANPDKPADGMSFVTALRDVSLRVSSGDSVAIVGGNGAGKTSLLRVAAGIYPPTSGVAVQHGRVSALTDITLGMDTESNGWNNIVFRLVFMGLTFRQAKEMAPAIADFCELGDALDRPIRTYSTGMYLRLAFAIATSVRPDILILDEMINAGDAAFREKANERLELFVRQASAILISTHDMGTVTKWCNRAIWLKDGCVHRSGAATEVVAAYTARQCVSDKSPIPT